MIATHIPGTSNVVVDMLFHSVVDRSDWKIHREVFQDLDSLWGLVDVYLFAYRISAQVKHYFSWRLDPPGRGS